MPGLVPGIHVLTVAPNKTWMAGQASGSDAVLQTAMPGHDEESIMTILPEIPLPSSIRSRYVDNINGLRMHVLEAGFETRGRPCVLLLHGFPELAF